MPAMIQADDLSKRYGRRPAVHQLTFTVTAGQICALLVQLAWVAAGVAGCWTILSRRDPAA